MTALGERPKTGGHIRTREQVQRPNGTVWREQTAWPPRVHREDTPLGPVVLVLRTHDLARAQRMAEVRWSALYPHLPMPGGVLEWRRFSGESWAKGGRTGGRGFRLGPSTGTETRSFPVVKFAPEVQS